MNTYQFTVDRITAGGKLNVYLTGTTTTATFYTDPAGTTVGTSPLTADGAGLFAPIYLDPSITYRIKVTNSTGSTTYYDIDPVSMLDEGTADGVLLVRSRDLAAKRSIPANVTEVLCAAYSTKGDRGQALYVRIPSAPSPTHEGFFQSADGAYWELSENVLNPFMFGGKGDNSTNDSPAIQAMFCFIEAKDKPYPVNFMGAKYYVHDALILPKINQFVQLSIDGGGATLRTDQAITILSCPIPADSSAASDAIGDNAFDISHLNFEGDYKAGQVGLHLIATYTSVVRACFFSQLDYGSIGTFCLASAWRDNRYLFCKVRGAVVQSAAIHDDGATPLWTGATEVNSPSNVSVFENCRVFGHEDSVSAFGIFASDAVRMNGCISEGHSRGIDVHFDSQGSGTVKQFHVDMFHAEAEDGALNFKVRSSGKVVIDRLIRSHPAAIYDADGSVNCEVQIRGLAYLGNMPTVTGTGSNPNGRWFYHSNGGGYGGTESGNSSGVGFRFENCVEDAYLQLTNPANWEDDKLPLMLHVRGIRAGNNGMLEWSNQAITFTNGIYFGDGSGIVGLKSGTMTSATTTVAANSTVTETFTVTGLLLHKHCLLINPYNSAHVPPQGIVWNAYIYADDLVRIRFTNVTGSSIVLPTSSQWTYCAVRRP